MKPPFLDRALFALLGPSLAIPISALALAWWRVIHADDAVVGFTEIGNAPGLFAAAMFLSVAFASACFNVVLFLRRGSVVAYRAIPGKRLVPHYVTIGAIAVWAVTLALNAGAVVVLLAAPVIITFSVMSCVYAITMPIWQSAALTALRVTWIHRGLGGLHALAVLAALVLSASALALGSDAVILGVAALAFLGVPWSGASAMAWLPLIAVFVLFGAPDAIPAVLFVLAAVAAILNVAMIIGGVSSERTRLSFANDFFRLGPSS